MFLSPERPCSCKAVSVRSFQGLPFWSLAHLGLNDVALLQDLGNDIVVSVSTELAFELALGCCVHDTLISVPGRGVSTAVWTFWTRLEYALVGDENLEAIYDLSKRNRAVVLPLADCITALDNDNIVVLLALEVDLALGSVSTSHFELVRRCMRLEVVVIVVVWGQLGFMKM